MDYIFRSVRGEDFHIPDVVILAVACMVITNGTRPGYVVSAIKLVRQYYQATQDRRMGLKEAKDIVDLIRENGELLPSGEIRFTQPAMTLMATT